jgi:hypothetical protein
VVDGRFDNKTGCVDCTTPRARGRIKTR